MISTFLHLEPRNQPQKWSTRRHRLQVYPMTHTKDKALEEFIDEQLAKGYIHLSISPYASSFFFIKKKDRKL